MAYDVLALDLDGTTLDSAHQIPKRVKEAILKIKDTKMVLLVTGRHHTAVVPYHDELQLSTPIISCNGTYVYDVQHNCVLAENALPHEEAKTFIALAEEHHFKMVLYVSDKILFSRQNPVKYMQELQQWAEQYPARIKPKIEQVDSFEQELVKHKYIWKFVLEGSPQEITEFSQLPFIQQTFNPEQSWHNRIDFSKKGNTKGARLAELMASQHISASRVVAVGDNYNDISMLTWSGLGVAMANADDKVKSMADVVTSETNDQGGVAQVIEDYF